MIKRSNSIGKNIFYFTVVCVCKRFIIVGLIFNLCQCLFCSPVHVLILGGEKTHPDNFLDGFKIAEMCSVKDTRLQGFVWKLWWLLL